METLSQERTKLESSHSLTLAQLSRGAESARGQLSDAALDLEKAQLEGAALGSEQSALEEQVADVKSDIERWGEEGRSSQRKIEEMEGERGDCERRVKQLEETQAKLDERTRRLEIEGEGGEGEYEEAEKKLQEVKNEVQKYEEKLYLTRLCN